MGKSNNGTVLTTRDGGYSWKEVNAGLSQLLKFHHVNSDLIYCITSPPIENYSNVYITGIGKSDLSIHRDTASTGIHYIKDLGTGITNIDSTIIKINDSLSYVVLFK